MKPSAKMVEAMKKMSEGGPPEGGPAPNVEGQQLREKEVVIRGKKARTLTYL